MILVPAVALAAAACSAGTSPGATAPSPAAYAAASARPAVNLSTAGAPNPAALPRTSTAAASVTLTAVGDMMLGITPFLPPDPASYFEAVEPALKHGAQIVFGNLEGTLTTATASKCGAGPSPHCFAFRNPPSYARYFKKAGFTVLNDANNHSHDFGAAGQAQTVRSIHAAGLARPDCRARSPASRPTGSRSRSWRSRRTATPRASSTCPPPAR